MTLHRHVVVSRIPEHRVAVVVDPDLHGRGTGPEGLEVLRRIEMIVEVDDLHDTWLLVRAYTGSPASTISSPTALFAGSATIWLMATKAAAPANSSGTAAPPRTR